MLQEVAVRNHQMQMLTSFLTYFAVYNEHRQLLLKELALLQTAKGRREALAEQAKNIGCGEFVYLFTNTVYMKTI